MLEINMQTPQAARRLLCVNCNIRVNKLRRHIVFELDSKVISLMCEWNSSIIITEEDYVCEACYELALQHINIRLPIAPGASSCRGHINVCILCGSSVLRRRRDPIVRQNASPLQLAIQKAIENRIAPRQASASDNVCHPCWLRFKRYVMRDNYELQAQPKPRAECEQQAQPELQTESELQAEPEPQAKPEPQPQEADQTKAFIAKVFHYLEHEFEVLKKMDAKMILINLSKLPYRTAMATGVSETTVLEILQEEARQNAAMRELGAQNDGKPEASAVNAEKTQRPARKRRRVCKKQNLAESSSEATDGSIEEAGQSSVAQDITIEPEVKMLVVKAEPFEYYNEEPAISIEPVNATAINKDQAQKDPISLDVKPESPDDDEMNYTNESLAVQPGSSKRRRISRKSDAASTHHQYQTDPVSSDVKVEPPDGEMNIQRTQAEYTTGASSSHRRLIELDGQRTQAEYTTGASSSHRRVIELDGRSLLRVSEVKVKRESDDEGFS